MKFQILLSAIAAATTFIGVVISLLTVRDKLSAQREFERILLTQGASLRETRARITRDGIVTPSALEELVACFEAASRSWPSRQQRLIACSFALSDA